MIILIGYEALPAIYIHEDITIRLRDFNPK